MQDNHNDLLPVVLSIAGSDSGGGAGIQADLKTFSALRVFGTTAITCVTAQTPNVVLGLQPIAPDIVAKQIKAVGDEFPVRAAKTGMLYSREIIEAVAAADVRQGIPILVVDPVMISSSGHKLLQDDAIEAMCKILLPHARVITPNVLEAEMLVNRKINTLQDLTEAAEEIGEKFDVACVAKGGHLEGDDVVDVVYDEGEKYSFLGKRIDAYQTHGAGCAFSAALTAYLAKRYLLCDAVQAAKNYVTTTLKEAHSVGQHHPLNFLAGTEEPELEAIS